MNQLTEIIMPHRSQIGRPCFYRLSSFLLFTCIALLAYGCGNGGGTSGTGGGGFEVTGTLRSVASAPLTGVQVSVAQADGVVLRVSGLDAPANNLTHDVTDPDGHFSLSLDSKPTSIALLLKGESFQSSVTVDNVPESAVKLVLDLVLNEETAEIEEQNERYEDNDGDDIPQELE
ncbi:MAG: hypothetical protein U0136_21025 [Bdellovibrionota bacterium]